jgi:hypothetical protein
LEVIGRMDEVGILKKLLIAWGLGFLFAFVLMERWRRIGGAAPEASAVVASQPSAEPGASAAQADTAGSPIDKVRRFGASYATSLANGVKADVQWVKETARRVA